VRHVTAAEQGRMMLHKLNGIGVNKTR